MPVRVFAPRGDGDALLEADELVPVPCVALPFTSRRLALGLSSSAKYELRRFAPTLIHIHSANLPGLAALRWGRFHNVPVVATCHTPPGERLRGWPAPVRALAWRALRWFYGWCAEVYVPSASIAAELRANGVAVDILEAPSGVDVERFQPARRSLDWRHAMGMADEDVVVALGAGVTASERLAVFAEVLRDLQANGLRCRVLVIGEEMVGDAMRTRMRDAVFTGSLAAPELATALASADVYLDPGEGNAGECGALEAMASGVCVVVAESLANRDVVRNGVDGLVCGPEDRAGLALVVRRLVENASARANLRQSALRQAARYNREALLGAMLENYSRVLRRWPLRRGS